MSIQRRPAWEHFIHTNVTFMCVCSMKCLVVSSKWKLACEILVSTDVARIFLSWVGLFIFKWSFRNRFQRRGTIFTLISHFCFLIDSVKSCALCEIFRKTDIENATSMFFYSKKSRRKPVGIWVGFLFLLIFDDFMHSL